MILILDQYVLTCASFLSYIQAATSVNYSLHRKGQNELWGFGIWDPSFCLQNKKSESPNHKAFSKGFRVSIQTAALGCSKSLEISSRHHFNNFLSFYL